MISTGVSVAVLAGIGVVVAGSVGWYLLSPSQELRAIRAGVGDPSSVEILEVVERRNLKVRGFWKASKWFYNGVAAGTTPPDHDHVKIVRFRHRNEHGAIAMAGVVILCDSRGNVILAADPLVCVMMEPGVKPAAQQFMEGFAQ